MCCRSDRRVYRCLPIEVEGPKRHDCQHLYFPKLHRRPPKYMIYHDDSSFSLRALPCKSHSGVLVRDLTNSNATSLCVMKGFQLASPRLMSQSSFASAACECARIRGSGVCAGTTQAGVLESLSKKGAESIISRSHPWCGIAVQAVDKRGAFAV